MANTLDPTTDLQPTRSAISALLRPSGWLTSLSAATLVLGLILTVGATVLLTTESRRTDREREARNASEVAHDLELVLSDYLASLRGLRGYVAAEPELDASGFEHYVDASGMIDRLPGLWGVEWAAAPSAMPDEVRITYLEPSADRGRAIGTDLSQDPERRATIERTVRSGRPEFSRPIELNPLVDARGAPGIVAYDAVLGLDGRFEGIVGAILDTRALLATLDTDDRLPFSIVDLGTAAEAADPIVLFSSDPAARLDGGSLELDLNGRIWEITTTSTRRGLPLHLSAVLAFVAGIVGTVFLAFTVGLLQRWGEFAEDRAIALNTDLRGAYTELEVTSSRLRQGMRSADVELWERNLDTGAGWTSGEWFTGDGSVRGPFLDRVHPDDLHLFANDPRELSHGDVREVEFRFRSDPTTDGELGTDDGYRWTLARSVLVERNSERYLIGAQIDVTERHDSVEQMQELNRLLQSSNQSLREFTRVASHDLRAPLRAIHALVGFLREDLGDAVPEEAENHLVRIEDRVDRLSHLIDDLLAYARADHRHDTTEPVDVEALVRDVVATAEERGALRLEIDVDVPTLLVSPTPLATCVRNLIDNAIKYHDDPENGRVEIRGRYKRGDLLLKVSDDGPGIDPAHYEAVWQPFRRLVAPGDTAPPGNGVGLSVIKRMAEAHGGSIELEPSAGRGTTFDLRWPATAIDPQ